MPSYSHSRLSTYESCPQQYKLIYIDKVEVEAFEGIELFLGSRVHDVLEKLYKDLVLSKMNTLPELLAFYKEVWLKEWHDGVKVVKKGFTRDHYIASGKAAIAKYYRRYEPFDQTTTLQTEGMVHFTIGDYRFTGYIDRLSHDGKGNYEIHDYKTNRSLPTQERLDQDRQLALYQIDVQQKFRDLKRVRLIWHYLLFDQELSSQRSEAQMSDLKKQVLSLIKVIEKDDKYTPKESPLCDWCGYTEHCPAKAHELKVADLPPNKYLKEKGVVLVNKYAALQNEIWDLNQKAKELKKEQGLVEEAAVNYADKEGVTSLTGSGYNLSIKLEEWLQFPYSNDERREDLEAYLKKAGLWDEVSGLDLGALRSLVEEEGADPRVIKNILEFAEEQEGYKVKLVKKKEGE